LPKRSPQRQAYRLVELARWRDFLGMPLNVQPKFFASGGDLASKWFIAASERDAQAALRFAGAVMRARWAEERDIADATTLADVARACALDVQAIGARATEPEVAGRLDAFTRKAIDAQVFGVPWYAYRAEPFWGQDRLDFLDRSLAK
jgi:2-hydroxychromene-2-carboxylate isomerase